MSRPPRWWDDALRAVGPLTRPQLVRTAASGLEAARLREPPMWWAPPGVRAEAATYADTWSVEVVALAGTHVQIWPMAATYYRALEPGTWAEVEGLGDAEPLCRRAGCLLRAARELGVLDPAAVQRLLTGPSRELFADVDRLVMHTLGETYYFAAMVLDPEAPTETR